MKRAYVCPRIALRFPFLLFYLFLTRISSSLDRKDKTKEKKTIRGQTLITT